MREIRLQQPNDRIGADRRILFSAIFMMIASILCGIILLIILGDLPFNLFYTNTLPWLLLTLAVTPAPLFYYWYRGKFDLFNPIVFASWSYFFPVFGIGGLIFTSGFYQPYYSYLIQDPQKDIPLAFIYVVTGFLGLWAGYEFFLTRKIGLFAAAKMPDWSWSPNKLILPGYILLGIGIIFSISVWSAGILMGFQKTDQVDSLDNFQYFLSFLVFEGSFLLWMILFKSENKNTLYYFNLVVLLIIIPVRTVFAGSRGSLFQLFIMVSMAYFFSGKKMNLKKGVVFSGFLMFAIMFGMIWGTTFRNIKGDESKINNDQFFDLVGKTVESISTDNIENSATEAVNNFSARLENFSVLVVIVSNYEKLAPYEEAYGLKDNIWTYTWTAFIPRIVWQDKPVISGARSYSELYFDYGDNAFPVTPIGDLLRNFGPIGVPLGMFVLGMFLRFLYSFLIESKKSTILSGMAYFMLITKVSYEGFYGTILPDIVRTLFIIVISLFIIKLTIRNNAI